MNTAEQATGLDTILRRIGTVTRPWGGTLLDGHGSLHHVHPDGNRPALYWCFNSNHEFGSLAQALGAQQPLVGFRSMNKVADPTVTMSATADALAAHYADHLIARFGKAPCTVGGNCQAALLAYRVALRLMKAGVPVRSLVTLDAEVRLPYPGHRRMLFGRDSTYNPVGRTGNETAELALRNWRCASGQLDWKIIDGAHGQYFTDQNITGLAREILAQDRPATTQAFRFGQRPDWRITRLDMDSVTIRATPPALHGDCALVPVWRKTDGSIFTLPCDNWVFTLPRDGQWECRVPKPPPPGPWTLWPVLCRKSTGPVVWPLEQGRALILH